MSRPTLYPDQQELEDQIPALWKKGVKRILVQAHTAFGKTIIFSDMAYKAASKGNKVLIVTHREKLLCQAGGSLSRFGLHPVLITKDVKKVQAGGLYVSMVKTLVNRLKQPEWQEWIEDISLIICDEAHLQEFNRLLENPLIRKKHILGFSATPKRTGHQRQLSEDYEEIICGPDVQTSINNGRLVTDKYFSLPVDMTGVHIHEGDYDTEEMFQKYNKPELYAGVIDNWNRLWKDTITMIFCVNIQHAINTCKAFSEAGIKAKFIVSDVVKPKLPPNPSKSDEINFNIKNGEYQNYIDNFETFSGKQENVFAEFERGDFYVLINVGIATTGYDYPAIQTILIDRCTTSENLLAQIFGRGGRTWNEKQHFNIGDFGENCQRLTCYYRLAREYSLTHEESKSKGTGVAGVKNCPQCNALLMTSSIFCKYCGYIFPKTQEQKIVELVEVKYSEAAKELKTIKDYEIFQEAKGYTKQWLFRNIFYKWGKEGLIEFGKKHNYAPSWAYVLMARFRAQGIK